jgi:putative transposase
MITACLPEKRRDRSGSFEPKMIAKGQTRFTGFDDKIVSTYARGMSTRGIQGAWKRFMEWK